jgi:tetratricopeptide (TPR) repeat protein
MQVTATLPDGQTRQLLRIRRWNFRWQQDYRFVTPVPLPRGTTLVMRFTYDNSPANADNPRREPVRVICGPSSTDEMANLGVQVVARSAADRRALAAATSAHDARVNLDGAEMLVRYNPFDAANRTFLAGSLVDAGRPADALLHLKVAIGLEPDSARAHNELGGAFAALGRSADALAAFERAAALAPDDDRMPFNVGVMLTRICIACAIASS